VIVESKIKSCKGCSLYKDGYCHWFDRPKIIPSDVIDKGCKYRTPLYNEINTTKIVAYIIDKFDGEIC
jgi:hypothetical protein